MKKFYITFALLAVLFILSVPSPSSCATKKAFLIGINDYRNLPRYSEQLGRWINDLKGPVNDVEFIKRLLVSRYDFREEDIKVLTESEATRVKILNTFESWLINGTNKGDLVLFYFSGHGTQVPDQNGDEDDGKDEAICAYEVKPEGAKNIIEAGLILDDELGVMLRKLQGREVVTIVDACHSGTMTRNIRGKPVSVLEQTPAFQARFIPVNLDPISVREKSFSIEIPKQRDIPQNQIFISSSRDDQLSLEIAFPDGLYHGALTSSLIEGMEKKSITYHELYEFAKKVIKDDYKLEQDPQIEPQGNTILTKTVFTVIPAPVTPEPVQPPAKPEPTTQLASQTIKPEDKKPEEQKPEMPPPPKIPEKPQPVQEAEKPPQPAPPLIVTPSVPPQDEKPPPAVEVVTPPPSTEKEEKILVKIEPFQGGGSNGMQAIRNRLKSLPHVELIEGDHFDRLIRGEVKNNKYYLRLLNRIGDVERILPAADIDELIKSITPHLEYAYIVKQLARISHPNPPFKVKVWVTDEERRDFMIGEKIIFNFYSQEDCYLLMINLDSQGNFHIIFPNKFYADNRITGGKEIKIPDKKMGKEFEFEFGEPVGEETIKVIATKQPLNLEDLGISKFGQLFTPQGTTPVPLDTRTVFAVKAHEALSSGRFTWSEDTVVIRSHERLNR
jgi:hypothetical protein